MVTRPNISRGNSLKHNVYIYIYILIYGVIPLFVLLGFVEVETPTLFRRTSEVCDKDIELSVCFIVVFDVMSACS